MRETAEPARTRSFFFSLEFSMGMVGVSAVIVQLTLMREMVGAFAGNELVMGLILGNWLLAAGVGSALGRWAARSRDPLRLISAGQLLIALLPLVQLLVVRLGRDLVFVRGAAVGVTGTALASLVLLVPYCLVSGLLLALASAVLSSRGGAGGVKRVYIADALGSVAGGFLFTYVLVFVLDHFGILCVAALLVLVSACGLSLGARRRPLPALACAVGVLALMLFADLDAVTTRLQYPGQEVVFRGNSPYGRLVVTRSDGQHTFNENGVPVVSGDSIERAEETVHYAMAQRPHARSVLLVSGGISGSAKEILKYPDVKEVTYVEIDPLLIDTAKRYLPGTLDDPRIRVERVDARLFVRMTNRRFDVVIVDAPEPSTIQANRLFTAEFFRSVAHVLRRDGVLGFRLGEYANYMSSELAAMVSCASRTANEVFINVVALPGDRVTFLASNSALYSNVAERMEQVRVAALYVNRHYLDATLTSDRVGDLRRAVEADTAVNRDLTPVLLGHCLRNWLSRFRAGFGLMEGALVVLLVFYVVRLRPAAGAVFMSGLAGSALVVVLLLGVQVLFGSVYQHVGTIVMVFMSGLALGAWMAGRVLAAVGRRSLALLAALLAATGAALPLALGPMTSVLVSPLMMLLFMVAIALLTLVVGCLVGAIFPVAGKLELERDASAPSRLYTADFIGASLGALFAATFLVPVLGVPATCGVVGLCNLAAAARVAIGR